MSSLFNQTNLAPGTSFASGAGNGIFPQGIAISDNGVDTTYINQDPNIYWSQPLLAVENQANSGSAQTKGIAANPFFAFSWDGSNANTSKSGSYAATEIKYQGNAGSGAGSTFLTVKDNAMNSLPTDLTFQMTCMSSIQCGTYLINAEKMCSTMKGYGWA